MQLNCKNCGHSMEITTKSYIKHLVSGQQNLCTSCQKIKKWEHESRLISGCAFFDLSEERIIHKYADDLYDRISRELTNERCVIRNKEGAYFVCKVSKVENGYISCFREEPFNDLFVIPICFVDRYIIIDEDCLKYNQSNHCSIIGYKGVLLRDGILGDERYIYEIGKTYVEEKRDPFRFDYQDIYSHFCIKLENVLGWRDFLSTPVNRPNNCEYRLFLVKGDGHCFENTPGNWVSNQLTLLREVSQDEILKYFSEHKIPEKYANSLEQYKTTTIVPYTNMLSREDIEKIRDSNIWWSQCNDLGVNCISHCNNYRCKHEVLREYFYLRLRLYIQNGTFSRECFEYRFLENNHFKRELTAILRLLNSGESVT